MLSFGEKIAKIGPADPEIIVLREIIKKEKKKKKGKKKEINASKIYSPVSKCAERAKLCVVVCYS